MKLPEYFEFACMAKTCSGRLALDHLPSDLTSLNAKKPLIITDSTLTRKGLVQKIINGFKASGMTLGIYDGVSDRSDINTIKELVAIYENGGFDAIIAAGQGIVVDIAKIVNIAVSNKPSDITTCTGINNIPFSLKPLVYVAVSSGNGKEASCEAVLKDLFYSSRYIMPDIVVTDPVMMLEEKPELVINTALRALTYALEASTSSESNPLRKPYSHTCIQLIMENLEGVVENAVTEKNMLKAFITGLKDKKGRVALASASAMGGIVYSNAPESAAGFMGKEVSRLTGVKEGLCMAVILPSCLEYNALSTGMDLSGILLSMTGIHTYCGTPFGQRFSNAIFRLRDLMNKFFLITSGDIPHTLEDTGIHEDKLKIIAASAAEAKGLGIDAKNAEIILQHAYKGTPLLKL